MKKKYGAQTNICWTWKGRKREYFEFWKAEGRQSQIVEHSLELPSTGYYPPSREELWKMSQKLPPAVLQRNRNCLFGSLELPKLPLWTMITLQAILVLCDAIWKSQKLFANICCVLVLCEYIWKSQKLFANICCLLVGNNILNELVMDEFHASNSQLYWAVQSTLE